MIVPSDHIHISEREPDGTWEDCTWDSGLEWYRLVYDAREPATHAEAQLLRRASGEPATGGSNMGDLARGIRIRYGKVIPGRITGFAALRAELTPGKAAVVQGSMRAFGSGHRLSRWQPGFNGAHAVLLMNIDRTLLWCDPLAPTRADVPVTVGWDAVERYVKALAGGQSVVGTIKNLPAMEDNMPNLLTYLPGHLATIKLYSNIRAEARIAATKFRTTKADEPVRALIGTVKGDIDPANGSNVWYVWWANGQYEFTAKDNVVSVTVPSGDVATASLKAQIADLTDQLGKVTADMLSAQQGAAEAADAERERVALAVANSIRLI